MLDPVHLALLVLANFAAAAFAGAVGMGGGVFVTTALSAFLPIQMVIPLQNLMMMCNSTSRTWMYRRDINWRLAWPFIAGLAAGVAVGASIYAVLPARWLNLIVGATMLGLLISPKAFMGKVEASSKLRMGLGAVHGVMSSLTSVGGVLQGVFARLPLKKAERNGTIVTVLMCGNAFKMLGYMAAGISLWAYWPVLVLAFPAGYAGTWVGKNVLDTYISDAMAQRLFQGLVLLGGLNLLVRWGLSFL